MFKKILVATVVGMSAMFGGEQAKADVYVRGYTLPNGTYVAPHYRSNPDHNFQNNWSTYPNVNPYTGQMGTRITPSYTPHTPSYSPYAPSYSPRTVYPSYGIPSISPSYVRPR